MWVISVCISVCMVVDVVIDVVIGRNVCYFPLVNERDEGC